MSPQLLEDALRAVHNDLTWKVDGEIRGIETSIRDLEANVERKLRDTIMSQVCDEFGRELDDIRRQMRGKGPTVSDQTTITTTPPPSVFQFAIPQPVKDLPTDELKMLLLSRLLEEYSFPTGEGMDLISLLRQHTAPSTDAETLALRASLAERAPN